MAEDISEEDKALFRQAVKGIKPLNASNKLVASSIQKPKAISSKFQNVSTKSIFLSSSYPEQMQAETILSYSVVDFSTKRFRDLKLGKITWQARLDLHGLKPEAAEEALIKFIQYATNQQKRSLLIIHGKGGQHQAPVLKNLVNHWLPQFPTVAAFHSAMPKDGGSGAVYVLLKRSKLS